MMMMDKTTLGDRMKAYEKVPSVNLMKKTPVIMRLDGKAFHNYTKQFKNEGTFSTVLKRAFMHSTFELMQNIQGARLAYMQSDEVSILLSDWRQINTDAWFKYGVQKMVSVASSMFTTYFNRELYPDYTAAFFDARVFNLPPHEAVNYFIWRQQDATRNSIQMLGRSYFSHKEIHGKNSSQIQDMLMKEHNVNWNDAETMFKRGSSITSFYDDNKRMTLEMDTEPPIFTQDREYIDRYIREII
jgi:tRNA(His) 5'-end guanylyltransferase